MKSRDGVSLVATIAVVALVAILTVATLSVTSRLGQGGALALRDARLDDAAASGLSAVAAQWRERSIGGLSVGASMSLSVTAPSPSTALDLSVTRVSADLFWVVSRARASDGSTRREQVILRVRTPDAASLMAGEPTDVSHLGFLPTDSIAAICDVTLPAGASWIATDGVIHALGDLTIGGGTGAGVIVVEGRLRITGPLTWAGVIIAKDGIDSESPSATVYGLVRAAGTPPIGGSLTVSLNQATVQDVLAKVLRPSRVAGRAWGEMY